MLSRLRRCRAQVGAIFEVGETFAGRNVSAANVALLPAGLHEQLAGVWRAHVRNFIRGPY